MSLNVHFTALVLFIATSGASDTVHLQNGKSVHGTVEARSADKIMLRTNDGLVSLNRSQIRSITTDEPAAARIKMAREALERGDLEAGFDHLLTDSETSPSIDSIADLLITHESRILKGAPSLTPQIVGKLDTLTGRTGATDRLLTALYAARSDWEKALAQYRKMKQSGFLEQPDARRKLASSLLPYLERARQSESLSDELIQLADAVYPDAGGTSTSIVLREISVASQLAQSGRLTSAVLVLAERVAPAAPELALQRSLAVLKQAQEQVTTATTVEVCNVIENHFAHKMPDLAAPVFEQHALLLWESGQFDAADAAADRLSDVLPDRGAALKHRVEFARRRSKSSPRQPKAAYDLALWAKDMGLIAESRRELELLRHVPEIRENVELQLKLMALHEEKTKVELLKQLIEQGKSTEALAEAAAFRESNPNSPLLKKVGELEELARYSKWNRERSNAARADAVYQNAERMFLQGRYSEALRAAESCSVDYPQTPAAEKAGKLRQRIEKELSRPR